MSKAAATTTIKFRRKIGAVSSTIVSPQGDLVQFYENKPSEPGKIYQDFTELTPSLFLVASSSRATENITFSKSVDVYVNDIKIEFDDGTGSSTTVLADGLSGHFQRARNTGDSGPFDGMTIRKNLVTAFGGEQVVVRMVGTQESSGQTDSIKASYNIPVQKQTGRAYHVTIASGDANNFVITSSKPEDDNGHCLLKVNVYSMEGEGAYITEGLSYQWQIEQVGGWKDISTASQVTITAKDVNSMANIRVIVKKSDTGVDVGMDIQTVRDNTDNFTIDLGANPTDETIEEGSGGKVTYTPKLLSNNTALSDFLFCFSVMDSAGNLLNKAAGEGQVSDPELIDSTTPVASFSVTESMCEQADGDVAMTIFAVKAS